MRIILAFGLAFALAGCASLSKDECLSGNWDEIGFRDGTNGKTSAFLQRHVKACEKTGVVPVQSVWEQGRQRGLPAYCVPSKAYSEGRNGRALSAVCPAAQIPALQAAHSVGVQYHEYTEEINELKSRIQDIGSEIIAEQDVGQRTLLVLESQSLTHQISILERRCAKVSAL